MPEVVQICSKCYSRLVSKPFKWCDWVKKWFKMAHWEFFWCPQCNNWCFDWYLAEGNAKKGGENGQA